MKIRACFPAAALCLLVACQQPADTTPPQNPPEKPSPNAQFEALRFADAKEGGGDYRPPDMMQVEVILDRLGFSSGVIDGKATPLDELALRGFQTAHKLQPTGKLDDATKAALLRWKDVAPVRLVTIPAEFAKGPFVPDLPRQNAAQAKYDHLGYRDLMEALAERFHTTPETLKALNGPELKPGPGAVIRVPNVADADPAKLGTDERGWNRTLITLGVSPDQPAAARVVVDKSDGALRAYAEDGALLAQFPATMGSRHDPLPIGKWTIQGVSRNPDFHYNPKLFWDVSDAAKDHLLKPGPNNPVGVAWLDLSKEHYGIHGTPEPAMIGKSESHGCVRLTNWDAARLAQMVKAGTPAIFQE